MPCGFGPPSYYVFTDAVEPGVLINEIQDPVGKEIDMRIPRRCEHAYLSVFAEETASDWKRISGLGDVVQGVCGRGVDDL